jgi:ComEC/Rec2-related protein
VHLLVISGQHVVLLAGLLYALVAGLARVGCWPSSWPWLPCACALALSGALAYGCLAGFEVPVRRACMMLAVVLLWRLRFRHLGVWLPLLLAFCAVLLVEPLASLQPGFWLSFAAVAFWLIFSGRLGYWSWLAELGGARNGPGIGLFPVLLALGLPISLSAPLANLLAVPWVSVLVVPMALLGTLLLPLPLGGRRTALAGRRPAGSVVLGAGTDRPDLAGLVADGCSPLGMAALAPLEPCCCCCRPEFRCASLVWRCCCRCCGRRWRNPGRGMPRCGCWMSVRAWLFWCAPQGMPCCMTPARRWASLTGGAHGPAGHASAGCRTSGPVAAQSCRQRPQRRCFGRVCRPAGARSAQRRAGETAGNCRRLGLSR